MRGTQSGQAIVAAVIRGNDTLLMKAYGKADVEWDVPMTTDALFEVGSEVDADRSPGRLAAAFDGPTLHVERLVVDRRRERDALRHRSRDTAERRLRGRARDPAVRRRPRPGCDASPMPY